MALVCMLVGCASDANDDGGASQDALSGSDSNASANAELEKNVALINASLSHSDSPLALGHPYPLSWAESGEGSVGTR